MSECARMRSIIKQPYSQLGIKVHKTRFPKHDMARCHDCNNMIQPEQTKTRFYCLTSRDYIEHEIKNHIECRGYHPDTPRKHR